MSTVGHEDRRHQPGVLFVHGVGDQRQSDTLLDFGGALLGCLQRWSGRSLARAPQVRAAHLHFAATDDGQVVAPPAVAIHFANAQGHQRWLWSETWWSRSNRRPGFLSMFWWSLRYLMTAVSRLVLVSLERRRDLWQALVGRKLPPDESVLALWIDPVYTFGLAVLYLVGGVAGYTVLLPLMVLAQVPLPSVQDFVLLRLIRPFLEVIAGSFRTYLEDDLQAANIHRRIADGITWLTDQAGCSHVIIVAHSEGAVVSFGMLTDPDPDLDHARQRVHKLITLGAGLNKSWDAAPHLARLQRPLPDHIHWLDIWSPYDPVPAGWLEPPRDRQGRSVPIFQPRPALVERQRLQRRLEPRPGPPTTAPNALYWPVSLATTNEMNVLTDHGAYFHNDEQVLLRLLAEIDADYYADSPFWRGATPDNVAAHYQQIVRHRRYRVAILALLRGLAVLAWLLISMVALMQRVTPPPSFQWLWSLVLPWPTWLPPVAGTVLLAGLACLIAFNLIDALWWRPWDFRERKAAMQSIAA